MTQDGTQCSIGHRTLTLAPSLPLSLLVRVSFDKRSAQARSDGCKH
jgi:hypothetical protein